MLDEAHKRKIANIAIPVPWGHISGRTYGDERSAPVLCVHGRGDNLESFRFLIPMLPKNYYYVCIDLPGHGKSSHAEMGYILDPIWYTLCIKTVIDYFKWPKVHYIGHSFGGIFGFFLAKFYPEIVLKLILIDTAMCHFVPSSETTKSLKNFVVDLTLNLEQKSNPDKARIYSLKEYLDIMKKTRNTEVSIDKIKAIAERNLIKVSPDQYKNGTDQRFKILGPLQFTLDQLDNMASDIKCPTLLLFGQRTRNFPPHKRLRQSPIFKIDDVEIHFVQGDHDLHLARPHVVAEYAVPFLVGKASYLSKEDVRLMKSKL